MHCSALIILLCLVGFTLTAQTGDNLGSCDQDQWNVEKRYDDYGFEQCGPNGWVYQLCPVGTYCYSEGTGVSCH